jgi:hypothetical protein
MTPDAERRYLSQFVKQPTLTKRGDSTIGGTVALFGKRSQPMGGYVEIIADSFCRKWSGDGWPGCVIRFDGSVLLGTTHARTLGFSQDGTHLDFEVAVPQHLPLVVEYAERNELADVALAWQVFEDEWTQEQGFPVRRLLSGRIVGLDVLTAPQPTSVNVEAALRSLAAHTGRPIEEVQGLSERGTLWDLFGWSPPESPVQREPVRLGRNGRMAYTKMFASEADFPKILDEHSVTATPADLVKRLEE